MVAASEKENFVQVAVSDQGAGIPEDEAGKIFEEFYRIPEHRERKIPGHGLGLAIVKRSIEEMGGRVWAQSPGKDQGATFYFTLQKLRA